MFYQDLSTKDQLQLGSCLIDAFSLAEENTFANRKQYPFFAVKYFHVSKSI